MNKRSKSKPPRLAQFIIRSVARSEHEQYLVGDLEENYDRIRKNKGILNAKSWYWYQCLLTFPRGMYNQFYWSSVMLKSYIKSSFRNLKKQPLFTGINITGLAIGIASSFLILHKKSISPCLGKPYPAAMCLLFGTGYSFHSLPAYFIPIKY